MDNITTSSALSLLLITDHLIRVPPYKKCSSCENTPFADHPLHCSCGQNDPSSTVPCSPQIPTSHISPQSEVSSPGDQKAQDVTTVSVILESVPSSSTSTLSSIPTRSYSSFSLSPSMGIPTKPIKFRNSSFDETIQEDVSLEIPEPDNDDPQQTGAQDDYKFITSNRFYQKLMHWLGKKNKSHISSREGTSCREAHYKKKFCASSPSTTASTPFDSRTSRKNRTSMLNIGRGGSTEEMKLLESGYCSPNVSAQPTPTAHHRLNISLGFKKQNSLELAPKSSNMSLRPRMSLPSDQLRRHLDVRNPETATERRRKLTRAKKITEDESIDIIESTGSISRPRPIFKTSSSRNSRDESTGEESGYEEDDPVEFRVPPMVEEERPGSSTSSIVTQHQESTELQSDLYIPFDQLRFGHLVNKGSRTNIYRGKWHGDVMIHTFDGEDESTKKKFQETVNNLSMIRHENIVLFMGACNTSPNLTIVTGVRVGPSLRSHKLSRGILDYSKRINIARQVAQAMSYLHSRGIIHGHLNTRNVYLESKIKLNLLDTSLIGSGSTCKDYAAVPQGILSYFPPEIMKTLKLKPPNIETMSPYTQQSDLYMYGALLYELFSEEAAFAGEDPHLVIYKVGNGVLPDLSNLQCTNTIKTLITDCWDHPSVRPVFPVIMKTLQKTLSLSRAHSTSEPEKLDRIGINTAGKLTISSS